MIPAANEYWWMQLINTKHFMLLYAFNPGIWNHGLFDGKIWKQNIAQDRCYPVSVNSS